MKRKFLTRAILLLYIVCIVLTNTVTVSAVEGTSYTYTLSTDQSKYIPTMDAYLPAGTYLSEIGLNSPEDMFLHGRDLYIADSGNRRIVIYSLDTGDITVFGEGDLRKPTGISVAEDGSVYVADYGADQVVIFAPDFTVKQTITRPTVPYYGSSPYKPQKVDLDSYGNLFVISEGTYEGILQFDKHGNFNGFFGANQTKGLSLVEWFQKVFYTDEQKAKMSFRTPPNIVSLDVAANDMVFSVTQNDPENGIKKLNMAGISIWNDELVGLDNFVDAVTTTDGRVYAIASDGMICEYADDGGLLLYFGGKVTKTDRNGLIAVASAIEMDESGNLYVLDKERGVLQVWYPTEYATLLHEAENDFQSGHYAESYDKWLQIMTMNPMAYRSYYGCARALFQLGRYEEAAELYAHIEHKEGYSNSYWEIRSEWLRSHMEQILIILAIFVTVCFIISKLNKQYGWSEELEERYDLLCEKNRLFKNLTADIAYFIRHPIDGVYYCKVGRRGGVLSATILYFVALIVYMVCRGLTSFVFGGGYSYYNDPVAILLIVIVPSVLFLIGSYLISSINDGEGSFRAVYVCFGYSLSVFIICWPILTLISHTFTLTELFVYQMMVFLILGYTCVMLFISIKEAHVYNLRKTTANILLTLFFMIVAILAAIILFILWRELMSFVGEVFEEVRYRVFS